MSLTIKELVVYTPAKDFELSKAFYSSLGFKLTEGWGGTMDCRLGNAVLRLQNYYVKDWANNFMIKLEVDDVDEWYGHVKKVVDDGKYGSASVSEPETVGGSRLVHVVDPSGVLLIFIQ